MEVTFTSKLSLQTFDILSHVFYKSVIEPAGDSFDGYEEAAPPYPDLGPAPALTQDTGNITILQSQSILEISKVFIHCM